VDAHRYWKPLGNMMKQRELLDNAPAVRDSDSPDPIRSIILAVGEISLWRMAGRMLHPSAHLTYAEFADLSPELIQAMAPDIVVSSLVSRSFDCLDLAQFLSECRFQGRYRIIDPHVPDPSLIVREINMLCPGLDVRVLQLSQAEKLSSH